MDYNRKNILTKINCFNRIKLEKATKELSHILNEIPQIVLNLIVFIILDKLILYFLYYFPYK